MKNMKVFTSLIMYTTVILIMVGCKSGKTSDWTIAPTKIQTTITLTKIQPTLTPTTFISPSPAIMLSPTPEYYTFKPGSGSVFRFKFEYPSNWAMENRYGTYENGVYTFKFFESPPKINQIGGTFIVLDAYKDQAYDMDKTIQDYIHATEAYLKGKILEDKLLRIDGYHARWIARELPPRALDDPVVNSNVTQVELLIVMAVNNDMYIFSVLTPESEKDGQFAQGFRTMVMGMKYIP